MKRNRKQEQSHWSDLKLTSLLLGSLHQCLAQQVFNSFILHSTRLWGTQRISSAGRCFKTGLVTRSTIFLTSRFHNVFPLKITQLRFCSSHRNGPLRLFQWYPTTCLGFKSGSLYCGFALIIHLRGHTLSMTAIFWLGLPNLRPPKSIQVCLRCFRFHENANNVFHIKQGRISFHR